jgi:hypothetical protein
MQVGSAKTKKSTAKMQTLERDDTDDLQVRQTRMD